MTGEGSVPGRKGGRPTASATIAEKEGEALKAPTPIRAEKKGGPANLPVLGTGRVGGGGGNEVGKKKKKKEKKSCTSSLYHVERKEGSKRLCYRGTRP